MTNLTLLKEWQVLAKHQRHIATQHMRDWFMHDTTRLSRFSLKQGNLFLDYSRQRILDETISLLCDLAYSVGLPAKIEALFSGDPINSTEKRPALHTALRDKEERAILVDGQNITPLIREVREKCSQLVNQIHDQTWRGSTGKAISHIVTVGIGGSFSGPIACTSALKDFNIGDLQFHFISSIDLAHINDTLKQIDPETTLFIISSKSFSTLETITNMRSIMTWMIHQFGENALKHHFIAVTAAPDKALAYGFHQDNIFPLWDWIGGRYSIWSAIGLPLMLMIGNEQFTDFLEGAYEMDKHFRKAELRQNMPVLLALLGVWYINFFGSSAQAIIPYAYRLRHIIPYLQQTEMESNGKSVDLTGAQLSYATSPILFGEDGMIGQHAYHQLLLQGKHLIPIDFIIVNHAHTFMHTQKRQHHFSPVSESHQHILIASALSQAEALMRGKTYDEAHSELLAFYENSDSINELAYHQCIAGNNPSNILYLDRLTPKNLGSLIALYEHKVFVQGVIWNINSFDQWGVELGKKLLPPILEHIKEQGENHTSNIDPSHLRF